MRRVLLLVGVTMLCGLAYLTGVWYGTQGRMTCTVTSPQLIQCGMGPAVVPPGSPAPATQRSSRV